MPETRESQNEHHEPLSGSKDPHENSQNELFDLESKSLRKSILKCIFLLFLKSIDLYFDIINIIYFYQEDDFTLFTFHLLILILSYVFSFALHQKDADWNLYPDWCCRNKKIKRKHAFCPLYFIIWFLKLEKILILIRFKNENNNKERKKIQELFDRVKRSKSQIKIASSGMKSAPQMLLNLYSCARDKELGEIMKNDHFIVINLFIRTSEALFRGEIQLFQSTEHPGFIPAVNFVKSLFIISHKLIPRHKVQESKKIIKLLNKAKWYLIFFFGRLFEIGSRVKILIMLIFVSKYMFILSFIFHYIFFMVIEIVTQRSISTHKKKNFAIFVSPVISTFAIVDLSYERKKSKDLFLYSFVLIEDGIAIGICMTQFNWLDAVICSVAFAVGFSLMVSGICSI